MDHETVVSRAAKSIAHAENAETAEKDNSGKSVSRETLPLFSAVSAFFA